MVDRIPDWEQSTQTPLAAAAKPHAARISPWKILGSLSALRIEKTRIKPLEAARGGRGGNADVIPAELAPPEFSEPSSSADTQHVAVKKMRLDGDIDDAQVLASLAHEVHLMSDLSHKNIVKVIGFVEDIQDGTAWMILPWEKNGNLREFVGSADWEFPERIALIYDVVSGIKYLHDREPPICHGDLKSLNVLINSKNEAIITDFGSARPVDSTPGEQAQFQASNMEDVAHSNIDSPKVEVAASGATITLTSSKWTLRWAAPELLAGDLPDPASDIWAFGWICWEVMTSNFPFEGNSDVSTVLQIIHGKLPTVHGDGRVDHVIALANLMIDCWNLDPSKRPTAKSCERHIYWMDRATPCSRNGDEASEIRSARLLSSIASMHIRHDRLSEAMDLLLRTMNIARSTKDDRASADAAHKLGEVYRLQGDDSKAEESYITARDISDRIGNQLRFAMAVNGLSDVYRMRGEYSKAEESGLIAREIYARIGNYGSLGYVLNGLGDINRLRGDYFKAEEFYMAARDTHARIGKQVGLAMALQGLGEVYRGRGEYSRAEESYIGARDIYTRIGNRLSLAHAVKGLGDVYRARGQYPRAEEAYITARDIYAQLGNQGGLANVSNGLGEVYRLRGEYSKAEELYLAAHDIYARLGNQLGLANVLRALGAVNHLRGESSKAEEFYVTARDIYNRIGNQTGLANVARALGTVYILRGESFKAEESYSTAQGLYTRAGDQRGLADVAKALGDIYRLREDYSQAEESYIVARDIHTRIQDQNGLANALTALGQLCAQQNDYVKAEEFYQEARSIFARIGSKYSMATNLWYTGRLYQSQGRHEEAESVVFEASTLFKELGLEQHFSECNEFLEAVRKD